MTSRTIKSTKESIFNIILSYGSEKETIFGLGVNYGRRGKAILIYIPAISTNLRLIKCLILVEASVLIYKCL